MAFGTRVHSPATHHAASTPRVRLDYLDGLRGLAALYVVIHHAYMEIGWRDDGAGLPRPMVHPTNWLSFGFVAVDIFIVLSGYCLMLPVARTPDGGLHGGIRAFLGRRALRILPPYYAALLLSALLILWVPGVRYATHRWPSPGPHFSAPVLLSHLFLFHNLSPHWAFKLDYPMWSIATEWQIYFLFPLLLLPLWRRFGLSAPVMAAFGLGIGLHIGLSLFDVACPWLVGLFALGMAGAVVNFSPQPRLARLRETLPWGTLAAALFAAFWILTEFGNFGLWADRCLRDSLVGLSAACLLVFCTKHLAESPSQPPPTILRLMQSRAAVRIGVFSYSLYLTHAPVLSLIHWALLPLRLSPAPLLAALLVLGASASLPVAYLFHLVFERPFMPGRPRTEKQAECAAMISPAP